jgi:hypothetical protein
MTSRLSPEDEALLRHARLGLEPTRADRSRIKRRIAARIMLGGAASVLSASTTATAGAETTLAAGTSLATGVKALAGLLVLGGIIGTGAVAFRGSHPVAGSASAAAPAVSAAPAPREAPSRVPGGAPLLPAPPPSPASAAPAATPSAPHRSPVHRVVATAPPVAAISEHVDSSPPAGSGPATVAAEAELLRGADASLRAGDGAGALALLNEHAARFPSGILIEEREAERVLVLCALGRTAQARESRAAFLRDHGRSPLATRVRSACVGQ